MDARDLEIFAATHSIVVGISLDPNYESDTSFAVDADLIMTASASVENTGVSSPLMSERIVPSWFERDIIEPIEWSPWRWPILWVRKKTGGGRICLDARGLNNLTIPDAFPSINVDHILRRLKRSKWISGHV